MSGTLRSGWITSDPSAVRALDQRVENNRRPSWALGIALAASESAGLGNCADDFLDELTNIVLDESRWPEGHAAFQRIRVFALQRDRSGDDPACARLLYIVEACAKVVYNASGSPAPFDANSGEKLVRWAGELAMDLGVQAQADIWRAVSFGATHI